jgi:hypothetical protein
VPRKDGAIVLNTRIGFFNIRANKWSDVLAVLDRTIPGKWQTSHYALDEHINGRIKRDGFDKFTKSYKVIAEEQAAALLKMFLENDPQAAETVCLHHCCYLVANKRMREMANHTGNGHRAGLGLFFSWEEPFFTPEARELFAHMRSSLRPFLLPAHGGWGRRLEWIIDYELAPAGAVERATYYSPHGWLPNPDIRPEVRAALLLEGEQ